MNIFTTDHPLVSQPKEHRLHMFFSRKTLILALLFSIVAEGICLVVLFGLPDSNVLVGFVRAFHQLAALVYLFFPDVIDGYATQTEEYIVTSLCFILAWVQWFFIFLISIYLFRKQNENIAA
jgi:hypothetical protein